MISHLAPSLGDVELGADVLDLFLFGVELGGIGGVVPAASGVCRGMFYGTSDYVPS